MRAGMDELLEIDDDGKESMMNSFYGGLDANENQQKMAELQFEAWMRMLDSRVRDVCVIGETNLNLPRQELCEVCPHC